ISPPHAQHAPHPGVEHGAATEPAQQSLRPEQAHGGDAAEDDHRAAHEIAGSLDAAIHAAQLLLDVVHGLKQLATLHGCAQAQLGMMGTELIETLAHGRPATVWT